MQSLRLYPLFKVRGFSSAVFVFVVVVVAVVVAVIVTADFSVAASTSPLKVNGARGNTFPTPRQRWIAIRITTIFMFMFIG